MSKKSSATKEKIIKKDDLQKSEDVSQSENDDECPEILEIIELEEALGTIFQNIHHSTIITIILGIIFGILFYVANKAFPEVFPGLSQVVIGFIAGLLLVFVASEIIILGVQGIKDKLNWNPYIAGILSVIRAALAELVVVTI